MRCATAQGTFTAYNSCNAISRKELLKFMRSRADKEDEQFIKQKANLSRLRDYEPNYQADRSTTERHLAEKQPVQTSQTQSRHQK